VTTREELLALAERCEKASGPDRELDAEIWEKAVYPTPWGSVEWDDGEPHIDYPDDFGYALVPKFTQHASVARLLIPNQRRFFLLRFWLRLRSAYARTVVAAALRARASIQEEKAP
jgi:hypothetical protein